MTKGILRNFLRFATVSIILLSLFLNVAVFTGGALLSLADDLAGKAFSLSRAATPEALKLATENDKLLKNVQSRNDRITTLRAENQKLKGKIAQLGDEIAHAANITARAAPIARKIAEASAVRVGRATAAQGTNLLAGWFPYAGTVVAGAFISWEIYDACVTLDYINSLESALNSEVKPTTCGINWKNEIGVLTHAGRSFVKITNADVPSDILSALNKSDARPLSTDNEHASETVPPGKFVLIPDADGLYYLRQAKWLLDSYYIEVR